LENKIIDFCKRIYIGSFSINKLNVKVLNEIFLLYIGLSVLDISKLLMYDYHYNVMRKHNGDKIELMYTDTGIIIIINSIYMVIIYKIFRFPSILYPNRQFL